MRGSGTSGDASGLSLFGALVQTVGATVTLSYIYWLLALFADMPRIHGASSDWHAMAALFVTAALLLPIGFRILFGTRRTPLERDGPSVEIGQAGFWSGNRHPGIFTMHLLLVMAIAEAVNLLTGWEEEPILTLFCLQLALLLIFGGIVSARARRNDRLSEIGGVFTLCAALSIAHIAFGGSFLAVNSIAELVHTIPHNEAVGLLVIRCVPYWQFVCTVLMLAALVWGRSFHRSRAAMGTSSDETNGVVQEYGLTSDIIPAWVARVARLRARPFIRGIPQSLLADSGHVGARVVLVGGLGWFSAFSQDTTVISAFARAFAVYWQAAAIVTSLLVTACLVWLFWSEAARRHIAIMYDIAGYWPRRHHPLAPLPYASEATARLAEFMSTYVGQSGRCTVVAHSQGSVLAYTSLCRMAAGGEGIDLVTCGSPLASLYATSFPAYFRARDFQAIRERIGSWTNVYRDTDPIGTAIFETVSASADVCILEPEPAVKISGHSGYWEDPQMIALQERLSASLG